MADRGASGSVFVELPAWHAYRRWQARYPTWLDIVGYIGVYVCCLSVFWLETSAGDLLICVASYLFRTLGLTLAYHRYFAHKVFKTTRCFQFVLAVWGALAVEKGPLWWASIHRLHHRFADSERDIHAPQHRGFLYCHFGWFLDPRVRHARLEVCPDLSRYPELIWLTKWNEVPIILYGVVLALFFGWSGLVWGLFISTVLIWQASQLIASVAHGALGYRRYATPDRSRNILVLSYALLGDGYHNNHHFAPTSARQGAAWWEFDPVWWVIQGLAGCGLVWDVRVSRQLGPT